MAGVVWGGGERVKQLEVAGGRAAGGYAVSFLCVTVAPVLPSLTLLPFSSLPPTFAPML